MIYFKIKNCELVKKLARNYKAINYLFLFNNPYHVG